MDATDLDTFIDALIDDLTPVPARDEGRTLFHLLDCPRRIVDEQPLLAVIAAAVVARNLLDHVVAQAVAAAERAGIPAGKHLRTGADLLTSLGVAPGAAHRAARVGRAAHMLPALTHHTAIHHGGWQVYLGADRHPWFIPPHDPAGPEPAHLRSHARRTMTDLPTAA